MSRDVARSLRSASLAYKYGGAEIARPDKTAPNQTARLNNGGHEQSSLDGQLLRSKNQLLLTVFARAEYMTI